MANVVVVMKRDPENPLYYRDVTTEKDSTKLRILKATESRTQTRRIIADIDMADIQTWYEEPEIT